MSVLCKFPDFGLLLRQYFLQVEPYFKKFSSFPFTKELWKRHTYTKNFLNTQLQFGSRALNYAIMLQMLKIAEKLCQIIMTFWVEKKKNLLNLQFFEFLFQFQGFQESAKKCVYSVTFKYAAKKISGYFYNMPTKIKSQPNIPKRKNTHLT